VSYTVTSGPATVSGSTLTITGAGSVTVQATQAGNSNYAAATAVSVTFTVNPSTQTISFPNPGTQTNGVAPITLSATASSGLAVSYTVTSGPATVSGSTLTITGVGSVTVQATQAGTANYAAATPVSVTFTVNSAVVHSVTLSWTESSGSVSGYNVYRSTQSGAGYTVVNSSLIPSPSYTDGIVSCGQTYYYVVTAVSTSGVESAYSAQVSAVIPAS
jgi:hypothetical protein